MSERLARGRRASAAFTRFWKSDKGLSIFSALLLLVVFVMPPLVGPAAGHRPAAQVVYALLLLSGLLALAERRVAWLLLMPAALATVAVDLASWFVPVSEPAIRWTSLVSLVLLLIIVLGQTFRAGPVNFHRIQGAVAGYLLLGVLWAEAYAVVALAFPGAFSGSADAAGGSRAWLYFSFVTLTTVGYGDVVPIHPVARSLAMLEAVTGPLYLAILLARLVSLGVAPGPRDVD